MGADGVTKQELTPACSGALALRRITGLLQSARRADAQGEHQQARELYAEILKIHRTLARASLGSIGKSLREVVSGVEVRLQQLRQELREGEGSTTCSSSRPTTNCSAPSSACKNSGGGLGVGSLGTSIEELLQPPRSGSWSSRPREQQPVDMVSMNSGNCWPIDLAPFPECPVSARDNHVGRPPTRDSARPCTQDGSARRPGTSGDWRLGTRPSTRDESRQQCESLDGVRPSTRDGARLQQMIAGERRRGGSRPQTRDCMGSRPTTRDGVRPPTRSGISERRHGQDVSIRQVTGRRKANHSQQAGGMSPATASPPGPLSPAASDSQSLESLSPCDVDESVELLG